MKKIKILSLFVLLAIISACSTGNNTLSDINNKQDTSNDKTAKSLVVYFSQTGSTKKLTKFIAKIGRAHV